MQNLKIWTFWLLQQSLKTAQLCEKLIFMFWAENISVFLAWIGLNSEFSVQTRNSGGSRLTFEPRLILKYRVPFRSNQVPINEVKIGDRIFVEHMQRTDLDQLRVSRSNWRRSLKVEEVEVQPPKTNMEWVDEWKTAEWEYRLLTLTPP